MNAKAVTYFDSFGVEHIPKVIKKVNNNKNIIANIFRIQANDSVMCRYFCIGFIDFMFMFILCPLKMANSIKPNKASNLSATLLNNQQFRLNKIN